MSDKTIMIVGAGYSGLALAHRLLDHGHDVKVISANKSDEIRTGPTAPLALTFPRVYQNEKESGLFFQERWGDVVEFPGVHLSIRAPGLTFEFGGYNQDGVAVAVDNRVKMADWLEYFEDRGGKVDILGVDLSTLRWFAENPKYHVIAAIGAGELGAVFEDDTESGRSGGAHKGVVAQVTLYDIAPNRDGNHQWGLEAISTPEGEIYICPQLTRYGPATCVFVMGRPGLGLDFSYLRSERPNGPRIFQVLKDALTSRAPDVYERIRNAELVDKNAGILRESIPFVHQPYARVGNGYVMGMADAIIYTDARSAQQVSNSALFAEQFATAINADASDAFTPSWMEREVFSPFWEKQGRHAAAFSDFVGTFWATGKAPDHFEEVMKVVNESPEWRDRYVTGFDRPETLGWLSDPEKFRALRS